MDSSVCLGCGKPKDCTAESWFVSRNSYGVPNARLLYNLLYFYGETSGRSKNFLHKALGEIVHFDFWVPSSYIQDFHPHWQPHEPGHESSLSISGQYQGSKERHESKVRMRGMFCHSTYCTQFQSSGQGCERTWTAGWQSGGSSPRSHPQACSEF